jgi:hypothetical protein
MPAEHVCPVAHAVPHAPQLAGSIAVGAHEAPHMVNPGPHPVAVLLELELHAMTATRLAVVNAPTTNTRVRVCMLPR